jgi:hypothetical protein
MTFDCTKPTDDIVGLDKLGQEGWEAVAMVSTWGYQRRFVHPMVLLKRPIAEPAS